MLLPLLSLLAATLFAEVHEPLHVGDVITVRGDGAFGRGSNARFWVGDGYAAWERIDDDQAVVVIPSVPAGDHWLSFARAMNPDRKGATGVIRLHVEPERERMISQTKVNLPSHVGDDMIRIDARGAGTLELRRMQSDVETAFARSVLINGDGPRAPPVSFDEIFVLDASANAAIDAITVRVPKSWLRTLPLKHEPELYLYIEDHGANEEVIPGVVSLRSDWDAGTRTLRATLDEPFHVTREEARTIYLALRQIKD